MSLRKLGRIDAPRTSHSAFSLAIPGALYRASVRIVGIAVSLGFTFLALPLNAQDGQPTTDENSTVRYPASYFAQFQPYSVNDMLDRIPGIRSSMSLTEYGGGPGSSGGSNRRGLGSGGDQVLINGRRIAGKDNEGTNQLSRIPASQLDYIEIIRGTSGDLDVRGGNQVINIVLQESEASSSVAYELNTDRYHDGEYQGGVKLSLTGQQGAFNYLLSGEREPRYEYRESRETSILGDGSPNDRINRDQTRDSWPITLSANLGYEFSDRDIAHLNFQLEENNQDTVLDRTTFDDGFESPVIIVDQELLPSENESWEVGGDYEHIFDNGSRFKTLFIVNESEGLFVRERFDLDDFERSKNLFLSSFERNREQIIRSSYTFDLFSEQSIEAGVERAQTILDTSLQLGLQSDERNVSDAFGGLTPIRDANGAVEELRYEYFAIHNWELNNRMSVETTLLYESSTIKQSGDVSQSRDFGFFRPKIDYRFDITPALQLRTTIEKDVAQLSFSDFTASAQNSRGTDDDQNELQGNPDLAQEQSWRYSANLEYRLPDDTGVISSNIFYNEIEDVIGRIDVSIPTQVLSANGNIGKAKSWGLNINSSLRLGILNQPNMLLTAALNLEDSKITDPFTGENRRLSRRGRGRFSYGLRHDIPSYSINWGFNINFGFDGNTVFYDIDKTEEYSGNPSYFSWIEKTQGWGGLTYRFEARDSDERCRNRMRYFDRSLSGAAPQENELSCFDTGAVLAIKVRGTF